MLHLYSFDMTFVDSFTSLSVNKVDPVLTCVLGHLGFDSLLLYLSMLREVVLLMAFVLPTLRPFNIFYCQLRFSFSEFPFLKSDHC